MIGNIGNAAAAFRRAARAGMVGRLVLFRASWTLIDQGIVSLGTFAGSVVLARHLAPDDYGTFAMVFVLLLFLQAFNTTLVMYPLTIRMAEPGVDRVELIWSSLAVLTLLTGPLTIVAGICVLAIGRVDLVAPVTLWFLAWQSQEAMRRVLFSEFRHGAAIFGDAIGYLGQAVVIVLLVVSSTLTLPRAIFAMAATSAVAAVLQYVQVGAWWHRPRGIAETVKRYWAIGRWALGGSLATAARLNGIVWLVAAIASRSAVAEFQAALNVVNLVNPIIVGLCNIIPPTAAHASTGGAVVAWRASRAYASLGLVPVAVYFSFLIAEPSTMLRIVYGAGSPYLDVGLAVRVLAAAYVIGYGSEMICSYLHGINATRSALVVNLVGTVATIALAIPWVMWIGWVGACWAFTIAQCMRLVLSYDALKRAISGDLQMPNAKIV